MRWLRLAALLVLAAGCRAPDAPELPPLPGAAPFPPALRAVIARAQQAPAAPEPARTRHLEPDGRPRYTNRLILAASPYLRQHAHNPVDWHPWGEEALAEAARARKPILLSIGYSSCHWCHVMEEESFEDLAIATVLNQRYVAIKVDREERPDLDGVYMAAVQRLSGSGGWPLTVWLTPERLPFYGGTYFPPRDGERGRATGFLALLGGLADTYAKDADDIAARAQAFVARLAATAAPAGGALPDATPMRRAVASLGSAFDATNGGFGRAPKFPRTSTLELLLRYHRRTGEEGALGMVTTTLERMAAGGIHDQVGGGFHRYAVDAAWRVPHFEKMLYDNALLASVYLEAAQATGREDLAAVARATLDYLRREQAAPGGGFHAATDADSPGGEGAYYTWTGAEIDAVLGSQAGGVVRAYFDVTPPGAVEGGRSVLWRPRPATEVAAALGVTPAALAHAVEAARPALAAGRAARAAPSIDRKILVDWNGLVLSALARAAFVLADPTYLEEARRAAAFLTTRGAPGGRLLHEVRDGGPPAFLDDHAFLIAGLLDLFEVDPDPVWLRRALALQAALDRDFADPERGGYFFTPAAHEVLLVRDKPAYDGAVPAGNSVAALNLLRLAELTAEERFRARAEGVLRAFGDVLARSPEAMPRMLVAADWLLDRPRAIVLIAPATGDAEALAAVVRRRFVPNRVLVTARESTVASLGELVPVVRDKPARDGRATAYVCEGMRCDLPTGDPAVLARQLAPSAPLP